jgi:AmmeMemoRadiSam system protein B
MISRTPAVAGMFYPENGPELFECVAEYLATPVDDGVLPAGGSPFIRAPYLKPPFLKPKALIVPHAGYVYSGPIAASAYRLLIPMGAEIERVVLLGPAHRAYLQGMAVPSVDTFDMPNGEIQLDRAAIDQALALPGVITSDHAHALEHSLEVQLPFLQAVLDDFLLVPVVVGESAAEDVARVLNLLWGGGETLIVVSSDLSHYHSYKVAVRQDAATTQEILARSDTLNGDQACGAYAINGLMQASLAHDLQVEALDVRNSGDTAGDPAQVVGYGAYVLS